MKEFTKGVAAVLCVYAYGKYKYKRGRMDEKKRLTRILTVFNRLAEVDKELNKKEEEAQQ
jgi:hypothetical protein